MASPQVAALFGYEPHELAGRPVETLLPENLRRIHERHRSGYNSAPEARSMGSGLDLFGRRRDGTTFPVDVSLAPVTVSGSKLVCAFIRDATERRRREDLLRFVNEISQNLLAGNDNSQILILTSRLARRLAEADLAWVVVPSPDDSLVVAAADGQSAEHLLGARVSAHESISARAIAEATPIPVADMTVDPEVIAEARAQDLGPGLYLPMVSETNQIGTLVVARRRGSGPFTRTDSEILSVFAAAASIVLVLGRTRRELEELRLVSEHERIARDLHDNVIQRLFALGLSLQGVRKLADGLVGERIETAVDSIDEVIREIRETIFELGRPATSSVRAQLRQLVTESAKHFRIQPRIEFRGPVDSVIGDDLATHLLAVTREAISNAARHGRAGRVDVSLDVLDGSIVLSVSDDGKGFPTNPGAGHGLANMKERAKMLGGSMRVSARDGTGALIEWRVPSI